MLVASFRIVCVFRLPEPSTTNTTKGEFRHLQAQVGLTQTGRSNKSTVRAKSYLLASCAFQVAGCALGRVSSTSVGALSLLEAQGRLGAPGWSFRVGTGRESLEPRCARQVSRSARSRPCRAKIGEFLAAAPVGITADSLGGARPELGRDHRRASRPSAKRGRHCAPKKRSTPGRSSGANFGPDVAQQTHQTLSCSTCVTPKPTRPHLDSGADQVWDFDRDSPTLANILRVCVRHIPKRLLECQCSAAASVVSSSTCTDGGRERAVGTPKTPPGLWTLP